MSASPTASAAPLLAARGLHLSHGATPALRGASLTVSAGETVAVTGPSGSGKSSLLHCMSGILRPDSGEVRLDGERLDTLPEERRSALRRTEFGIVFQFGQLVPELTALDNTALPLLLGGARRKEAQETAGAWLERFGVRGQAGLRPGEMSGGQAQRVALARALVTGPRAVFADEPTGALDSLAAEQVMTALVHAVRESGTALLLVTHDARTAAFAEREVTVLDGTVHDPSGRSGPPAAASATGGAAARRTGEDA
ncbi:ABC transporter ATP-binding protein [Streptomyces sp. NPDC059506]|uniref:ABC transporter ATP-binding protein n=1 Tax=Streptomyces TaxID=1883 RepID=UPI0015F991E9|nr:ABC transporter ATP-binding protein [Streptomyces sp. SCUT-3]QMV23386.1 ATP-binding cassette domain-containing protein [Streptomyces sp. SCUT-3]